MPVITILCLYMDISDCKCADAESLIVKRLGTFFIISFSASVPLYRGVHLKKTFYHIVALQKILNSPRLPLFYIFKFVLKCKTMDYE